VSASILPRHTTSLVGRERELAEIKQLFASSACRLITLVGPGGVGKSRIALEAGQRLQNDFLDGVFLVDLTPLPTIYGLVPAITTALGYKFPSDRHPQVDLLLSFLREKHLLLILDNFEHLLDGARIVADILQAAPDVQILVTSRAVLKLQPEWIRTIDGLPYPALDQVGRIDTYEAVQLFTQRAQQMRRDFRLEEAQDNIARICRLVGGLPLALELAASWLRTLDCQAIADEIQHNLDILWTTQHDVPERQRSIRVVFDHTWHLLSKHEREALQRLTVFRGGFTREAAEQVAGASLDVLAALVDRSLLWLSPLQRYSMHELLRLYTAEQLERSGQTEATQQAHSLYFMELLHQQEAEILGGSQHAFVPEKENLAIAWQRAVTAGHYQHVLNAARSLEFLYTNQGWSAECVTMLRWTVDQLREPNPVGTRGVAYGHLLGLLGTVLKWGEPTQVVKAALVESLSVLETLGAEREAAISKLMLGAHGKELDEDPEFVRRYLAESLEVFRARNDRQGMGQALCELAMSYIFYREMDHYALAKQYLDEATAINQTLNDRRLEMNCLRNLGHILIDEHQYERAGAVLKQSLSLAKKLNVSSSICGALSWLGHLACAQGELAQAKSYYLENLALAQDLGADWFIGWALYDLGDLMLVAESYPEAKPYFERSLKYAHDTPQQLGVVAGLASVEAFRGNTARAARYLAMVLNHPRITPRVRDMAERARVFVEAQTAHNAYQALWQEGQKLELGGLIEEVATLSVGVDEGEGKRFLPPQSSQASISNRALTDPLTSRELEILQLVGRGYSNQEIAEHLVLSKNTVRAHLKNLYSKLAVNSRTRAIAIAQELHLI
jgi:predicted ATPase/DNA-binding CsgD family transcriptional regulator